MAGLFMPIGSLQRYRGQLSSLSRAIRSLFSVFEGAAAAYSVRIPAGSTYNGPLLRVRRSSDNAEQDIGATSVPITRQNYNPNPTFAGSTVGAAQPAGTVLATLAGLTTSVVATGNTSDGLPYVDWRVSGTPTSAGAIRLQLTNANTVGAPCLLGQRAVSSIGLALSAGSFANLGSLSLRISERNSSGALLGSSSLELSAPTSAVQRVAYCAIAQEASCAIAHPELNFSAFVGLPVDVTLRLSVANIESQVTLNAAPLLTNVITTVAPIGFLDVNALDSFVPVPARSSATTSVFVPKWYDQSGNGRDAAQTTAGNQPRIVNAGVVDQINSKPSLVFSGSQHLESPLSSPQTGSVCVNSVQRSNVATYPWRTLLGLNASIGLLPMLFFYQMGLSPYALYVSGGSGSTDGPFTGPVATSSQVYSGVWSSTGTAWNTKSYVNGSLSGERSQTAAWVLTAGATSYIGKSNNSTDYWNGPIAEIVVNLSAVSTTNRQALERSQGTAFGITVA